jgi:hypothetical protein
MDMDICIFLELSLKLKKTFNLKYTPSPPGGCVSGVIYFVQGGGGRLGKRLDFADECRTAYKNDILGPNKEAPAAWHSRFAYSLVGFHDIDSGFSN